MAISSVYVTGIWEAESQQVLFPLPCISMYYIPPFFHDFKQHTYGSQVVANPSTDQTCICLGSLRFSAILTVVQWLLHHCKLSQMLKCWVNTVPNNGEERRGGRTEARRSVTGWVRQIRGLIRSERGRGQWRRPLPYPSSLLGLK